MKHSILAFVIALFVAIPANATLTVSEGCYQIGSADDLFEFAELFYIYSDDTLTTRLDCAKLTQDIVVNENVLKADGTPNEGPFRPWKGQMAFVGTFDGQNHTIAGLYQVEDDDLGLFDTMTGTIKNLGIVDSYFSVPEERSNMIGALISFAKDSLFVENCFNNATIEMAAEGHGIAGLVGKVGWRSKLTIKDSYNEGLIVSSDSSDGTGGLVGYVGDSSKVTLINSYNTGIIRGGSDVGGLIGEARVYVSSGNSSSTKIDIKRCYNSGLIYGSNGKVGGLIGSGVGVVRESYNIGTVDGGYSVGGLVGAVVNGYSWGSSNTVDTLRIENSYNRGKVELINPEWVPDSLADAFRNFYGNSVGGIVGEADNIPAVIENSYNAADVVYDGNVMNYLVGTVNDCEVKMKNSVNRNVAGGTLYKGVVTVDDSLFNNGVVATYLHEYSDVWGQESIGEGKFPDLSGTVNSSIKVYPITWRTFDGDTAVYPSNYTEGLGIMLPADVVREGYLFDGWYAVASPSATDSKIDKIKADEMGAKTFYAQWVQIKAPESDGTCYLISSVQDLYSFASIVNGINGMEKNNRACGMLTQDIVVNEQVLTSDGKLNLQKSFRKWIPMMDFEGSFDGDGHSIYGLYYDDRYENEVGFIGEIYLFDRNANKAEIKNLGLEDFYFRGNEGVGAFVGKAHANWDDSYFTITNSHSNGVVEGMEDVGGFIGEAFVETQITGCYNMSSIIADEKVGGFVGYIAGTSVDIIDSYNSGLVAGKLDVGGLAGYIYHYHSLYILRSYNAGEVEGVSGVGGLVGTGYGYPYIGFVNSYNKGRVVGYSNVAGLLGEMTTVAGSVDVFNSYNAGEIVYAMDRDGVASLVGYGKGGSYSFDNAFYLNQNGLPAFNKDTVTEGMFVAYNDSGFVAVTEEQLMGGSVAESLRGWFEKWNGKPTKNGQDGFAWAEDPPETKILPHLNLGNTKHRVSLVLGDGGQIAPGHELTYYEEGVPVNLPDSQYVTRDGYIFVAWYDNDFHAGPPETSVDVSGTVMKVYYAEWKVDSTLISSSSEPESSSSEVSSSSEGVSSSSAKSSSSSTPSSSSAISSSSSAKSSSSSKGKDALPEISKIPQFSVSVVNRTLQVAGARVGDRYALFDMQGNVVLRGTANSANFSIAVPVSGHYVLRIGYGTRKVTVGN